jgi:hypothetical protein
VHIATLFRCLHFLTASVCPVSVDSPHAVSYFKEKLLNANILNASVHFLNDILIKSPNSVNCKCTVETAYWFLETTMNRSLQ